jgi:hypothetical protein
MVQQFNLNNGQKQIPEGWRYLIEGEEIKFGDLLNCNATHPNEEPLWRYYQSLIGSIYSGMMMAIRQQDPNAESAQVIVTKSARRSLGNNVEIPSRFSIHVTATRPYEVKKTIKVRVQEYLNKK